MNKLLNVESLLQNGYFIALLAIFLTMYGPRLHPTLPNSLRNLFNNRLFRVLVMFLVVYLSNKNLTLSLTITIIFVVTMSIVNHVNAVEMLTMEKFYGAPVSRCKNYENINKIGTAFYPMSDTNSLLKHRGGSTGPHLSNVRSEEEQPSYNDDICIRNRKTNSMQTRVCKPGSWVKEQTA